MGGAGRQRPAVPVLRAWFGIWESAWPYTPDVYTESRLQGVERDPSGRAKKGISAWRLERRRSRVTGTRTRESRQGIRRGRP